MKVSIVGATAYTSRELIKLLARHPEAEIVHLGGRREEQPLVSDVFPSLVGVCDLPVVGLGPDDAPERPDVAFLTLPHAVSHQYVPKYLDAGIHCIDFSADYRFGDLALYEEWYGEHGDAGNIGRAVYGIPELFRDQMADADLLAVAGCYPTATILALAPLLREGLIDPADIVVDAKSGITGMGNKPVLDAMYCERNENVQAYRVAAHRHEPEMEHILSRLSEAPVDLTFVPHLVPMDRGILATSYARLTEEHAPGVVQGLYEDTYADEPFVRVCPPDRQPRTKDTAHTNYCDIAVTVRPNGRVVVTSALDNIGKGASSAAVQCLNAMFGLDETTGLL